ncbi:MAG TPA: hypothetical protein DGT23_04955 [Micromonosporaceae bacterium]|nr:hypothetical protein [Micromonosporaceae bacterium]
MRQRLFALSAAAMVIAAAATGGSPASAQTAPTDQITHSAASPGQDLTGSVTSLRQNPDGTFSETSYTPRAGVTPAELARKLTANGVPGVRVTGGTTTMAAAACSYGTARTWPTETTCFARWSYNGWARPQMYFRDRSNSLWPVGRAVTKWNETSGIDSHYRTFSAGCPSTTVHCVIVYNAAYGKTGEWEDVVGLTRRYLNAQQTYYTGAYIALNESYGGTEYQRWNTACHEIGHVLGLGHNTSTTSCVYTYRTTQRYPNGDDFNLLERYY